MKVYGCLRQSCKALGDHSIPVANEAEQVRLASGVRASLPRKVPIKMLKICVAETYGEGLGKADRLSFQGCPTPNGQDK